jgi:hypothetical protein
MPVDHARAQTAKPALVRDVDEPGRNPYQQLVTIEESACPTFGDCFVTFAPVPAGKRLVLTHASVKFSPGGTVVVAYLVVAGGGAVPLPAPVSVGSNNFLSVGPVTAYFEPGQTPAIRFDPLANGSSVEAFLAGYYVSLP